VTKVLGWARQQEQLKLVADQISGPTWTRMLAEITCQLICQGMEDLRGWISEYRGLYHLAGSGFCSRYEWGEQILQLDPHREQQVVRDLIPAKTAEFPAPAERPLFSALNCDLFSNTFHLQLPDWKIALKLAMEPA
jgi:dTDP-4-dehydrorhamnose reductase